jgi:hypothetical protein
VATVSEVAVKYAARGAQKVQRADQNVRESIQTTADTARQNAGEVDRWMQRNKTAILGLAAATTGAMAAIISASPTLSAHLSQTRLGFELLAQTIGQDVSPATEEASKAAVGLAKEYANLPQPLRKVISSIIFFGGVLTLVATAAAGLESIISGTLVATLGSKLLGAITGVIGGSLLLQVAIGGLIGLFGVWALEALGVFDIVQNLGAETRNLVGGPLADLILTLLTVSGIFPAVAVAGAALVGFFRGGIPGAVSHAQRALDTFRGAFERTIDRAFGWGADLIDEFIGGLQSRVPNLEQAA